QDLRDVGGGERPHHAYLQKIHATALGLDLGHGIQEEALGATPPHQGEVCGRRSVQLELEWSRDLLSGGLELRHPLAHHRNSVVDALCDMSLRAMLVAGGREDPARRSGEGPAAAAISAGTATPVTTL